MEKFEQHQKAAPQEHQTSPALQEALNSYKVCKDSTVVIPPARCPEEDKRFIDFSAKI